MAYTVINPQSGGLKKSIIEVIRYRELLFTLTYRDLRVKYSQTFLGLLWAVINPLLTVVILTFVFGIVAKVDTGNVPHSIYTLAGMVGWTFFSVLVVDAGNSIVGAQDMVKKIYFPRLVIPLSKVFSGLIDLVVVLVGMAMLMLIYRFPPPSQIIYLPIFIFIAIVAGLAGGIWISALTVRFRDFKHIVPMIIRIGLYATPIAYPASSVPEKYQFLFHLNPMAGVVEGTRWCLVGGPEPSVYAYFSVLVVMLLFVTGLLYFVKVEKIMADIL